MIKEPQNRRDEKIFWMTDVSCNHIFLNKIKNEIINYFRLIEI